MANKIRLTVGGIEYMVVSDESEPFVRKIGEDLNAKLEEIKRQNGFLSTTMVAVLAALDYSEQLAKCKRETESLALELKTASEEAACARLDVEAARKEIDRLAGELAKLR